MANGAYAVNIPNGTYDIVFAGPSVPGGSLTISGVTVAGFNVDAGDHEVNGGGSSTGGSGGGSSSGGGTTSPPSVVPTPFCGFGTLQATVVSFVAFSLVQSRRRRDSSVIGPQSDH